MQERPKLKPELWFSAYNDYLYNYARLRINDNGVIGDLIQDTYLAALKSSKNFKGLAKERTWLTAILKNKIVDHYRHNNSKKGGHKRNTLNEADYECRFKQNYLNNVSCKSSPADPLMADDLMVVIEKGISQLNKKERSAIRLPMENIGTDVICDEMGIEKTISGFLFQGQGQSSGHIYKGNGIKTVPYTWRRKFIALSTIENLNQESIKYLANLGNTMFRTDFELIGYAFAKTQLLTPKIKQDENSNQWNGQNRKGGPQGHNRDQRT